MINLFTTIIGSKSPFLLDFRLATHGLEEGTFNVHPFTIRQGLVFAHNGIINDVAYDKKLSDTQVFNRDILKYLKKSFLKDDVLVTLIEGFLGTSKLVFLDKDKSYKILNEDAGSWNKGVWYSNTSYSYQAYTYPTYNKPSKKHSYGGYGWSDDYDDFSFDRETKQDKEATKFLPNKEQCGWCGDMVDKLNHTNISDMYNDDEPTYLWMCDGCTEVEDAFEEQEKEHEEMKRIRDNQVALLPLSTVGKS